jgi:hypothetical protein
VGLLSGEETAQAIMLMFKSYILPQSLDTQSCMYYSGMAMLAENKDAAGRMNSVSLITQQKGKLA